jgi:hypothetical protein
MPVQAHVTVAHGCEGMGSGLWRICEAGPVEAGASGCHIAAMTPSILKTFVTALALIAMAALAGCTSSGTPQDGRYQTHGGGWDNFRA